MLRLLQFLLGVKCLPERIFRIDGHFHVGLACAHPDFADEDVVEFDGRFRAVVACGKRIRSTCVHEREGDRPFAVFVNCSFFSLFGERDGEFFAGLAFSGEDDGAFALQDHVGGEDVVETERFHVGSVCNIINWYEYALHYIFK